MATAEPADILDELGTFNTTITNYDLAKNDWSLKSEEALGRVANVQGAEEIGLFIESADDESFEVFVRWTDESGKTLVEADQNIDAELASTSPGGANHFVFLTIAIVNRYVEIVITDTSTNSPNRIDGTINFH